MRQYLDLVQDVLNNGELKDSARGGIPRTIEVYGRMLRFDLSKGFPLLTTKKVSFKNVALELLWFLSGSEYLDELSHAGVHIWDGNYQRYDNKKRKAMGLTPIKDEDLSRHTKSGKYLYMGNIYGRQWRHWGDSFDQINHLIRNIKLDPNSRYHIVTAWNPTDFLQYPKRAALPACHVMFQCNVRNGMYLDLSILQRSCDLMLGVPYNIASYALLDMILARETGLLPGELIWYGNSVHIYENHIVGAREQLTRSPKELPRVKILDGFKMGQPILQNYQELDLINYNPHPEIKFPLAVGI